jgi:NAD(P)-dependent dehydrogenase (short-subunit alcohol dehydrogenase family)
MKDSGAIVVLGATSAIAQAFARRRAAAGARFALAGRRQDRLNVVAADLVARGAASAESVTMDLSATGEIEGTVEMIRARFGPPREIIIAYGMLGEQAALDRDLTAARAALEVNFTSAALWLLAFLKRRDAVEPLTAIVIGSVAGDRGRRTNFIYGAAKGGLDIFVQGLAHAYAGTVVRFVMVKPGFVDTPMTAAFVKGGPLWSSPDRVPADIERAVRRGARVIYTPWFWRPIMAIIRRLPWFAFRRLKI